MGAEVGEHLDIPVAAQIVEVIMITAVWLAPMEEVTEVMATTAFFTAEEKAVGLTSARYRLKVLH